MEEKELTNAGGIVTCTMRGSCGTVRKQEHEKDKSDEPYLLSSKKTAAELCCREKRGGGGEEEVSIVSDLPQIFLCCIRKTIAFWLSFFVSFLSFPPPSCFDRKTATRSLKETFLRELLPFLNCPLPPLGKRAGGEIQEGKDCRFFFCKTDGFCTLMQMATPPPPPNLAPVCLPEVMPTNNARTTRHLLQSSLSSFGPSLSPPAKTRSKL